MTNFDQGNENDLLLSGLTHSRLSCKDDMATVTALFEWLTSLPPPSQQPWKIQIRESTPPAELEWLLKHGVHQGQGDLGLVRRGGKNPVTGEREDPKWILHVKKGYRDIVKSQGGYHGRGKEFLDACERVLETCFEQWNNIIARFGLQNHEPEGVLRLIRYDPVKSANDIVAAPHWDRNSGTTHLWESHNGLWVPEHDLYGPEEPAMRLLSRACNDEVHIFSAAKLAWHRPDLFLPVWHRGMSPVVDVPRMVAVYFHHHTSDELPPSYSSHRRDPLAKRIRSARSAVA